MNLLAIETATPACAMALRTSDGRELSLVVDDDRHHTEALTPGIRTLLDELSLSPKSIDRVVIDRGPGLFTGLRVGIATAIGFALGASADLVSVTSLEVLAHGAHVAGVRGTLVSCVDGRRGEVFVQSFALGSDVVTIDEPRVMNVRDLVTSRSEGGASLIFTGDGAVRYANELVEVPSSSNFPQVVPSPAVALGLGARRAADAEILPLYLREADAVANFTTRERLP